MAATSDNYYLVDYHFRGLNGVDLIINPAKAQRFGISSVDLNEILTHIKNTFYLDDIIAGGTNIGGTNYHYFWGTCIVGGLNDSMHKDTRRKDVHGDSPSQSKRTFDDSGLNTKGKTSLPPDVSLPNVEIVNIGTFNSKSAYFVDGSYGVQINPNNLGWINVEFAGQSQNNSFNTATKDISEFVEWNDVVRFRSYHLNDEGLYVSSEGSAFTVLAALIKMKYSSLYASYANAIPGEGANKYYTVKGILGGHLFDSADGQNLSPNGYYVANSKWYKLESFDDSNIVLQSGNTIAGQWPAGDPANFQQYNWVTFSTTSQVNACTISSNPRITYLSYVDNKHYKSEGGGGLADNGWYCFGNNPFRQFVHIVGGIEIERGDCNPPT